MAKGYLDYEGLTKLVSKIKNHIINNSYEANLKWGGKNHSADYGPIDAAMIPNLGANRLAFMPVAGITVEYSRDGGSTWHIYPVSDSQKLGLFNGNGAGLYIGNESKSGIDKSKYKLRITLDTEICRVYTALNKICVYCSTSGSSGSYCTIQGRTRANKVAGRDTWVTFTSPEKVSISGWSGYNIINTTSFTTYGNSDGQYQNIRFTFGVEKHLSSSAYSGLSIYKIMGFGGVGWSTPSNLASEGRLYSYDNNQNMILPAGLQATSGTTYLGSSLFLDNGGSNYGAKIDFCKDDQGYAYIKEDSSDHLRIHGNQGINLTAAERTNVCINGSQIAIKSDIPSSLPAAGGISSKVYDINGSTPITFAYSSGGNNNPEYFAVWNGYQVTYTSKAQVKSLINTDTHHTAKNVIGASSTATTNAAATSPYLNLIDGNVKQSSHQIKGGTDITVKSDASGNITIDNDYKVEASSENPTASWGGVVNVGTVKINDVPKRLSFRMPTKPAEPITGEELETALNTYFK